MYQVPPPGGQIGVYGYAADIGIYGWGANFGVGGSSAEGYGGFFRSDSDHLDLALGGPVGRINTDPHNEDSQLYLSSNADVIVKLDNDGGEDHTLRIQNSGGTDVCTVSESGVLGCTNTSPSMADAALYGVDGGANPDDSYGVYSEGDIYGTDDLIVDDEVVVGGPLTVFGSATFFGAKSGYVVDVAQNGDAVALETGDVVVISGAGPAVLGEIPVIEVRRATPGEASAIVGVVDQHYVPAPTRVTATPGGKAESASFDDAPIAPGEYLTLVTLGAFKAIKVDASYGKIAPGDLLAASPNPGYAMRAVSPEPGTVVGKALGALESGTGVIPVMVTLQ
jgi:hypothetical protein